MATPTEWLNEFQVNLGTANTPAVQDPEVTGLSNGNFLVTWTESGTNGVGTNPGFDIIGKIFDAEGNVVRDSFRANSLNADNESDFDVAATNDGGFVIVYMDNDIGTTDNDVIYQRYNSNGSATSTQTIIDDGGSALSFRNPQITVNLQNNTAVLQFENTSGGDRGVFLRTLSDTGGVTNIGTVNDDNDSNEFDSDIAMLANGNVVSVWTDSIGGDGVQFRVQTSTGGSVAGPISVDGTGRNAQVTALADGGFVVAYENYNVNNGGITAARYNSAGALQGFTQVANSTDNENEPDVIALPDGDFVVVWDNDTDNTLEAQRFNADGTADGSLFTVENVGTVSPAISVTGDGRILFAWESQSGGDIFTSIWDPRSNPVNGTDYDNNTRIFLDTNTLTSRTISTTVNGTGADDTILGQGGNDLLISGPGEDTIRGGAGGDTIRGGLGTDELFGDAGNDRFEIFNGEFSDNIDGGGNTDTLDLDARTTGSGANVDLRNGTYTLQGPANTITGVEIVLGTQLADTLRGIGNSELFGDGGNDTFDFRIGDGTPDFSGGGGTDTADFSAFPSTNFYIDLTLGGYRFNATTPGAFSGDLISVENYDGGGGIDVVTGNASSNVLRGNNGNDILSGLANVDTLEGGAGSDTLDGGTGADKMLGGANNDIYIVDNAGDIVDESVAGSSGFDIVRSSVTANLGTANYLGGIEAVTLTGGASINAIGNLLGNVLTGNNASNVLNGQGGADNMRGVGGNDTYVVDNAGDFISESLPGSTGFDRVLSSVTMNLSNGAQVSGAVERIELTGSANVNAIGNLIANGIFGNSGNNTINGLGGSDNLTGGGGADNFAFTTALGTGASGNVDTINDFTVGVDRILLENAIFVGLAGGGLSAANFRDLSTGPRDANDFILYNPANGALFYDSDGSGAAMAEVFAIVDPGTAMSASDFFVV